MAAGLDILLPGTWTFAHGRCRRIHGSDRPLRVPWTCEPPRVDSARSYEHYARNSSDSLVPHVHMPHVDSEEDEPPAGPSSEARGADSSQLSVHGRQSKWLIRVGLEVLLISVGVFLALMGEQWRENAHTRELAHDSLRRFRAEIVANRKAVAAVKDYHVGLLASLRAYLAADPKTRQVDSVQIRGLQPVFFEQTAWDLALATQSLTYIDPQVAYEISRIYGLQRTYSDMTHGIMQAIYLRPVTENFDGLANYYGDLVLWEPQLLRMYDEVLPKIDRVLP